MGGGGHVVDASNGPRRLRAGGHVNPDGGVVMVATSLTQVMFVVVVRWWWLRCRRRWRLAAVSSTHVIGVVVVDVVVGSVDVDVRVIVVVAGGCVIDVVVDVVVARGSVDVVGKVVVGLVLFESL